MKDYITAQERMLWPKNKKLGNTDFMWTIVCLGICVFYVCYVFNLTN